MNRLGVFAVMLSTGSIGQNDPMASMTMDEPGRSAQIVVTINPEARVSAVMAAALPPPVSCTEPTALKVKIVNQGQISAPLQARLISDGGQVAAIHMDKARLSGSREEERALHILPGSNAPVDLTIAFSLDGNIGDLGGRDRVHFIFRCDSR
jgi:hypothetical protein